MNVLLHGTCAGFNPDNLSNKGFNVTDISGTDCSFSEDIRMFRKTHNNNPDAFICYGDIPAHQMDGIRSVCKENSIPLILCSSQRDERQTKKLSNKFSAGYFPSGLINFLTPAAACIVVKEQARIAMRANTPT